MVKKLLLTLVLLIWGAISASSQLFRYLDTDEGLSSRRVIAIEEDSKGYMWFLTQEGVDRYDGKEFVHYPLSDGQRILQHFPNQHQLHIDAQDDVWVTGTNGHVFKYNRMLDQYDQVLNFADTLKTFRRLPLTHLTFDRKDHLWLCTRNKQYIYHTPSQVLIKLINPIEEEITFIEEGPDDCYFIGTNHHILQARLKGEQLETESISALDRLHRVQYIHYHALTQRLLIGTMADGFYVFDLRTKELQKIGQLNDVTLNAVIPSQTSDEEVFIATDGNGIYRFNMQTLTLNAYLSTTLSADKMSGDIIKDIHLDSTGKMWLAVFPINVTVYSENYPKYQWLRFEGGNPQSMASNQITSVIEDSDGDLWVATSNGVGCFDTSKQEWTTLLSKQPDSPQEQNVVFLSLCEASPGTILVGGYMSGMYRIHKKDMHPRYFFPHVPNDTTQRPDKYIRSIYRDEEGNIWAGGYYNFKKLSLSGYRQEFYETEYPITAITSKSRDELWIGTINGLYKFNKKTRKLQNVNLSLEIGTVNTIFQLDSIHTYIGSNGSGLWLYNNQNGRLQNFHTDNSGLISNNIYCILPGNRSEELLISTDRELVSFNRQEQTFRNWTREQGLIADNFNPASGIQTRKGERIFGCDQGLIVIQDSLRLPSDFRSKLVFKNLSIKHQSLKPGMEGSPLSQPIDETNVITLAHDQNILSLEIGSINHECPSRILYSWKLEGFDEQWTAASEAHTISYTNLSPGTYTLKIRAIWLDEHQVLEERSLRIHIEPPFSRSPWAFLIYLLLFLSLVFAVLRYLWLRKESALSREKIRFFIQTAHDIRTPLTLIKGPLNEMAKTEKLSLQGEGYLKQAIQHTDRLTELSNQLIEFQKEELYSSSVHVSLCELNEYLSDFLKPFQAYAESKGIHLTFERTADTLEVYIDRHKIESIFHNLVSNALKYTPENGEIRLVLSRQGNEWQLVISDTGIGIPADDQKKMFKQLFRGENAVNQRITGSGIGMLQTYRLVKRHQGKISMTSRENEGTTFCLRFPTDHRKYIRETAMPTDRPLREMPESSVPTAVAVTEAPAQAHRLLIVEDNPELRDYLHRSLAPLYRIEEAENGQKALERIRQEQPDLIISDILMPVMKGDELCQQLKSNVETSHLPVILLTALGDKESILRGLDIKADSYVVKPFDMDILKAKIASLLANKEFIRQRFAQGDFRTEDLPREVREAPGFTLDQEFLKKATELVHKNLKHDFNVDTLCTELGMSRSSLYQKIKALTGHSPSDFVREIRMKEAAALLKSRKYSVGEVADLLGYSEPKYFTDVFKKHYGVTPSAYMKNN